MYSERYIISYIYIYIERERDINMCIYIYICIVGLLYIYIYIYISLHTMHSYTARRRGATRCHIRRFARDVCERPASAARCDVVLHRAFRARDLQTNM